MEAGFQSTAGGPDSMPFKRKITPVEAPKRSSRRVGNGKRKVAPAGTGKARKLRSVH